MLKTFITTWLAIASPPAPGTRRAPAPWTRLGQAGGKTAGTTVHAERIIRLAPWGDVPGLHGLAVVTTEPFPAEWWRKPRLTPPPADPFGGAPHSAPPSATSRAASGTRPVQEPGPVATLPTEPAAAPAQPTAGHSRTTLSMLTSRAARRGRDRAAGRRTERGRFARLCLVVAGALISWIVVDAAAGHGKH